jgi:hypothetical protein
MKITHVEVHRIDVPPADPPFKWRRGLAGSAPVGDGAVLRIGTDEGAEGVALFARPGAAATLTPFGVNGSGTGSGNSTASMNCPCRPSA